MTTKAEFLKAFETLPTHFEMLRDELHLIPEEALTWRVVMHSYNCMEFGLPYHHNDMFAFYEALAEFRKPIPEPVKSKIGMGGMVSGRAMCKNLVSLGVPAQKIVRNQETGDYTADFFTSELAEPVAPAKEWAQRIVSALPTARIVATHDTHADWRPNRPVIYATVLFNLGENE